MYRHCIHCFRDLGSNTLVEHCPIGQRLAYDPVKGRLWVVCRECERWNLTPFDERWEALEEAERLFRSTRLRYSTANVGLARLRPGVDLVRIGSPLRPELAAWRYGDQFGRRRLRHLLIVAGAVVAVPIGLASITALASVSGVGGISYQIGSGLRSLYRRNVVLARPTLPGGEVIPLTPFQAEGARLLPSDDGWTLALPDPRILGGLNRTFHGEDALALARGLFPLINRSGGSRRTIERSIQRLEQTADLNTLFEETAVLSSRGYNPPRGELIHQPSDVRLALEMLLHEQLERRSLEGELWHIERAWKEAEAVAAIADELVVPAAVSEGVAAMKRGPEV